MSRCRAGCDFYGSPATLGYCSTCFKKYLKEHPEALAPPPPAPSTLVVPYVYVPSTGTNILDLPNEILQHIFSFLSPDCVHTCIPLVCTRFRTDSRADPLWLRFAQQSGITFSEEEVLSGKSAIQLFFMHPVIWDATANSWNRDAVISENRTMATNNRDNVSQCVTATRGYNSGRHAWEVTVEKLRSTDILVGLTIGNTPAVIRESWLAYTFRSAAFNQGGDVFFGPAGRSCNTSHRFKEGAILSFVLDADRRTLHIYHATGPGLPVAHVATVLDIPSEEGALLYPAASIYHAGDCLRIRGIPCPPQDAPLAPETGKAFGWIQGK